MDGVLVVDKPEGLTSHDVVAAARRALGETRIGHTGTLDPLATGVLPLACGRATRLVRFLSASDKDYEATIRFGFTTDSFDVTGAETSRTDREPSRDALVSALASLGGEYLQTPPSYSAKKVAGRRAYDLARRDQPVALAPAPVRVARVELVAFAGTRATVVLTCSAGFYVRSFAHALGQLAGTGACLEALQRTRSGEFGIDEAISMAHFDEAADMLIPMERLLPSLPAVTVTSEGLMRVSHGRMLDAGHLATPGPKDPAYEPRRAGPMDPPHPSDPPEWVRVLDPSGTLVALATAAGSTGSLHPSVVLI